MHAVAPLIDKSSGESPLTVEYPGNGVVRFNAAIRVAIKRYNHAVTWATRHFISLISISKKYESNFKEISKLHLLVVIYECTSGQRKHSVGGSRDSGTGCALVGVSRYNFTNEYFCIMFYIYIE